MALYALDDLDDALDATRAFLWPVDLATWAKLALVALFIGGPGANANTFQYNVPAGEGPFPREVVPPDLGPVEAVVGDAGVWALIAGLLLVGLLIALAFALVGSVMEFVFVESLRRETVDLRAFWTRRWRQGLRLFGFRLVVGLFVLGGLALVGGLAVLVGGPMGAGTIAALVLLLLPILLVMGIVVGLVSGFTTVFVVPIMVLEDCGVLAGWRRLWPTIAADPAQYLAYAIAGFVLSIAGGIVVAIATGVGALVLLVPFGVLGAIGFGLLSVVPAVGWVVVAVAAILFVLAVVVVAAVAQVPVQVYLRYYALFVLGDTNETFDLVPEQRAAVRE